MSVPGRELKCGDLKAGCFTYQVHYVEGQNQMKYKICIILFLRVYLLSFTKYNESKIHVSIKSVQHSVSFSVIVFGPHPSMLLMLSAYFSHAQGSTLVLLGEPCSGPGTELVLAACKASTLYPVLSLQPNLCLLNITFFSNP